MDDITTPEPANIVSSSFDSSNSSESPVSTPLPNPVTPPVVSADYSSPSLTTDSKEAKPPQVGVTPQAIVKVLSPRGVEYVFLTIALFTAAAALTGILISFVNGKFDFSVLAYPTAVLVVSVPVFAWLFLRLKNSELRDPSLKLDPSKRRSTQFTQIGTSVISFFALIGLVGGIFAKLSGQFSGSVTKLVLDVLVILVVSGGILAYYWRDEHRPV